MVNALSSAQERFQALLREMFEFDCADLDFGIYRIMNYKRRVIDEWISRRLPEAIAEVFRQDELAEQAQLQQALESARRAVKESLGEYALDSEGNLREAYYDTPVGKRYLDAYAKARGARAREALETDVYNHLYTFFSRYWQDGDFISKRRYSAKERYAIPYNGEEVYLYWANYDQYYIKTGEYFTDYAYKAPNGVTVRFKLHNADVEQNNVKGEKRFFLVKTEAIAWDKEQRTLTIPVEFRPLTPGEIERYGHRNQQEAILQDAIKAIAQQARRFEDSALLAALTGEYRRDGERVISRLEHHLRQYARRNTGDFFIHKDLRGFLTRELDFYLKNEVLHLDEIEAAGERRAEGWFQLMRAIKRVGAQIIKFLAQIEDFQKMLWEKKKFVTETFYVITVGAIREAFYPEIAACEAQWQEWEALFGLSALRDGLFSGDVHTQEGRRAFLKAHPTLPLDTRHFSQDFTDRLLASFGDLEEMTDGLLVHSENWQALNLLQEKYRERVKCIYIDPPYNTGNDGFLYKDTYRHSSWLTMVTDRLVLGQSFLDDEGIFISSIDDNERTSLEMALSLLVGEDALIGPIAVQVNRGGRDYLPIAKTHEYLICATQSGEFDMIKKADTSTLPYEDGKGRWIHRELRNRNPKFNRENRPNLFYPVYIDPNRRESNGFCAVSLEKTDHHNVEVLPKNSQGRDSCWRWGREKFAKKCSPYDPTNSEVVARERQDGGWNIYEKHRANYVKAKSIWSDPRFSTENGSRRIRHLFGNTVYDFPKPVELVGELLNFSIGSQGMALDFFAGSGTMAHAVINLNREDGGRRKFILVEMAHYFDTVLLPRVKKVTFAPEWKDGKPKRMATPEEGQHSPRLIKVIRLESYEDALNNLTFDDESGRIAALQFGDAYLLRYMLKWETRRSETLLDVDELNAPFSYRLHLHRNGETQARPVDLPETFNYLLGLDVQARSVYDDNGRRYLVYRGAMRNGRTVAVIWRETQGWTKEDYERDRSFVTKRRLTEGADEIFVNGGSLIPGAQSLDPIFKARMFAGVEA